MFEIFKDYLSGKAVLTVDDFELIQSVCIFKKFRKHQYLLQAGDVCQQVAFVCKGLLRFYFISAKGAEHIMQFVPEYHLIGDRDSLTTNLPSKYNIDAIEESEIVLIKKNDFDMLRNTISAFNDIIIDLTNKNVLVLQERINVDISHTAEEKYNYFLAKHPAVINRIPLHMIASCIGISPETLSRIRSNSNKK